MKTVATIWMTTVALMVTINLSGKDAASHSGQVSDIQNLVQQDTLKYTVYGMDCPGCEGGLVKQVNKLPWVASSKASWKQQELEVVVKKDSVANVDDLETRVRKANFTLVKED